MIDHRLDLDVVAAPLADWRDKLKDTRIPIISGITSEVAGGIQKLLNTATGALLYEFRVGGDLKDVKVTAVPTPVLTDAAALVFGKMLNARKDERPLEWIKKEEKRKGREGRKGGEVEGSRMPDETEEEIPARKSKRPGCLAYFALVGGIAIGCGAYLLSHWDSSGGASKTGAIVLVVVGTLALLPPLLMLVVWIVLKVVLGRVGKEFSAAAKEMVAANKAMYGAVHEFRPATDGDFDGLDRDYYERTTRELAERGFRHLGDLVDKTIEGQSGLTTPIRVLSSADGSTQVGLYHFKLPKMPPQHQGRPMYICDVATEFSDGTFLLTSNTQSADLMTPPPRITKRQHPLETTPQQLIEAHEAEKQKLLAAKGGDNVTAVVVKHDRRCGRIGEAPAAGEERTPQVDRVRRSRRGPPHRSGDARKRRERQRAPCASRRRSAPARAGIVICAPPGPASRLLWFEWRASCCCWPFRSRSAAPSWSDWSATSTSTFTEGTSRANRPGSWITSWPTAGSSSTTTPVGAASRPRRERS
jgi:hypothetical protein